MAAGDRQQILTIAGRWRQCLQASGMDKTMPRREQSLAMLTFYAGFSAALEASLEISDLPEAEAVQILQALHVEVKQVEGLASRILGGITPS